MKKDLMCNLCGRKIICENDIPKEDFIEVNKKWGYFSGKDRIQYHFILCEECSDKFVKHFAIPVEINEVSELL